ncbi:MAG: trigger factor [Tissierellia bacterium]|nr:trigger factor [Tissierellia bacterium]
MNTKILEQKDGKATIEWILPWDEFKTYEKKAYMKERGRFRIDGFRKGKAPKHMIENYYGKGIFYEDALNMAIADNYESIVEKNELDVVGYPSADVKTLEEGQDVVIELETEVYPEFTIENVEDIEIPLVEEEVTPEMVDLQLKQEQEKNGRQIFIEDRPAKMGDTVIIDFEGYMDGEPFEGGKDEDAELELGSGRFIPGFEEQIVGKNVGDAFDIEVSFPEDYHAKEYAGKKAIFKTVLNGITEIELPELDDDFASEISEFETLDELKEDFRKKLEESLKENIAIRDENAMVDALVAKTDFVLPEAMLEDAIDQEIKDFEYRMSQQGLTMKAYYEYTNSSEEQLRQQMKTVAEKKAKVNLTLAQAAKQLDISITDEDRETAIKEAAGGFGMDPEKFYEMAKDKNLHFMDTGILNKKTVEHLMEKVKRVKSTENTAQKEDKKTKDKE